ncbi:hypothetical protein P606_13315 [Comamonas thiooxydans]|uniref:Uncharacterized protein n=1 Tax=Comamonas thiooxydans TaxID=363952 RepID=A0A0E3B8D8_9BURK|nr:hypothetical protein P245_25300 [Comamonas thiooxydans]KGH23007.1 hypothetical protein P606_13315 [Comamonas thiooxydans]
MVQLISEVFKLSSKGFQISIPKVPVIKVVINGLL